MLTLYSTLTIGHSVVEPCEIDFWQSVGIGIGFLRKCRFSVGIFLGFSVFFEKLFVVALLVMLPYSVW
jgi:hypothetical protein